jgi:hypothetical protein
MAIPVNIAHICRPLVRPILIYPTDAERGAFEGFHRSINRAEWTRNFADALGVVVVMKIGIPVELDTVTD